MISVILPVYNREKTIKQSIDSILQQTYKDFELIIVDDGSTDGTKRVIKEIGDSRIVYVYQDNSGACVARNRGIDMSRGEYIAFHDSDDTWISNKLEKQFNALIKSKADIVICKMKNINEYGIVEMPKGLREGVLKKKDSLMNIGTQSILGKKEVFEKCRFDTDMPRLQDFELLLRISKTYKIYFLDETLVNYYTGGLSISSNESKFLLALSLLERKHPQLFEEKSRTLHDIGKLCLAVSNQLIVKKNDDYKICMRYALRFLFFPYQLVVGIIYKLHMYQLLLKIYYYFKHK